MSRSLKLISHYTPLRLLVLPLFRITVGVLYSRSASPDRFYEVTPKVDSARPFEIWLDVVGAAQLRKIKGTYELPTLRTITSQLEEEGTFWEVGAGWGYFSMAVADRSKRVVAFEEAAERARAIEKSIDRNGFDNVTLVRGRVGGDVDLTEFPTPDVVLMDIEGWEYEVLSSTLGELDSKPTWVVEIHDPDHLPEIPSFADPDGVRALFEEHGYSTADLSSRERGNYHLVAEPEG